MILSDFLSRQIEDDSNLHEIIPISFNIRKILQENYQNIIKDTYMVQTRLHAKAQLNATTVKSTKPVAQKATLKIARISIKTVKEKDSKPLPSEVDRQLPKGIVIPPGTLIPSIVMQPNVRLIPKPPNVDNATTSPSLGPEPKVDFEENSSPQEGIITQTYVAPDQSYLEQLQELIKLVNTSKVVQKYLLQQADIIKRKVVKGMHFPLTIKEIQAGYLTSSFFQRFVQILSSKHNAS